MPLIFISHSSADAPFAKKLFNLLRTGCDLRLADISCSSVEGAGIETGEEFIAWIQEHLATAGLVLLVLSDNYYASTYCLAELGAAWALKRPIFPLALPSVDRDPGVVFLGRQSARVDRAGLYSLFDRIGDLYPPAKKSVKHWNGEAELFLDEMVDVLTNLPEPNTVSRTALERVEAKAEAAVKRIKTQDVAMETLRAQIQDLESAVTTSDVNEVRRKYAPAIEAYEAAVEEMQDNLRPLSRVEGRAIIAYATGEGWAPSAEVWRDESADLKAAIQSRWMVELEHGDYIANEEHPRYVGIFVSLGNLESAIRALEEDDRIRMEGDAGYYINAANFQYWVEAILKNQPLQ